MGTHSLVPSVSIFDFSGFFLLGVCKDSVHCEDVQNVNELCERIVRAAECVTSEMLVSTWRETEYRLDALCATNGVHVEIY